MGLVERLPEHLKQRRTAEAVTAPSAILLAGAGTAVGVLGGIPLIAAAGLGALAWGARVAFMLPRRGRRDRIEPMTLGDPWRRFVMGALDAQRRYGKALRTAAPGPMRERLADIGQRVDAGVHECWRIARRGDALEDAMRTLDTESARQELAAMEEDGSENTASTRAALTAQVASADRIATVAADVKGRLQVLEARLDEAVARAVELSLGADDVAEVGGLGGDVDALVSEMESLRQGLEEVSGASGVSRT